MSVNMCYVEKCDINKAIYLTRLTDDKLKDVFFPNIMNERDDFGNKHTKKSVKVKCNMIKKYAKLIIQNKGKLPILYEFKTNSCNERLYAKGAIGFQGMKREVRAWLAQDNYVDIDMKNAQPTIVKYIKDKQFPHLCCPLLDAYVNNRELFLSNNITLNKQDVIQWCLFEKKCKSHWLPVVKKFYNEVLDIKKALFPEGDFGNWSSLLAHKAQEIENEILQKALKLIDTNKVGTLIFDGFLYEKDNDDNIIDILNNNEELNEYGIEFKVKELKFDHEIDLSLLDESKKRTYNKVKIEFEEKFLKINVPTMFLEEYIDPITKVETYHIHDSLKQRVDEWDFDEINEESGKWEKKDFYPVWIKDANKRVYQTTAFYPTLQPQELPSIVYNTFLGYKAQTVNIADDYKPGWFINHCKLLCNNVENDGMFLVKYIAHLLQKPQELPEVGIVMRGKQGAGKDSIISCIEKLIGKKYVYRTSNMNDAFGNFTSAFRDTLVFQFNEVEGKDGFQFSQKLKDLITREENMINEKNIRPYGQANMMRVFLFTNAMTPLDIPPDDRRFVVLKTCDPQEPEYYEELWKLINNENVINKLYTYLINLDITSFKPRRERPQTENYKFMKEMSINPIYTYLYKHSFNDYEICSDFIDGFFQYLKNISIDTEKWSHKLVHKYIHDIEGITRAGKRIDKKQVRIFKFDEAKMKQYLYKFYFKDTDIEADSEHNSKVDKLVNNHSELDSGIGNEPFAMDDDY